MPVIILIFAEPFEIQNLALNRQPDSVGLTPLKGATPSQNSNR
jgi:hypothetical protein